MPPLRTLIPIKAVKTERTHEENQERAYIAASRRSDRSLEARVESARRASEIHKRRTGRSLRVTEQDVINEEMYEEEDDDLPSQYRRLTAHLQTGSADFNRRLAAYLTNHVAMRSALDQAITQSYAQQFPDAPHFAHNHPGLYPSPLLTQGNIDRASLQQLESPSSPHTYRQTPYPMPGTAGYRPGRTASTSASDMTEKQSIKSPSGLSASTPVMSPIEGQKTPLSHTTDGESDSQKNSGDSSEQLEQRAKINNTFASTFGPLTMTLPGDSQQLLAPALDPTNPFNSLLMGGNDASNNYFDNNMFTSSSSLLKDSHFQPNLDGMNSTLAPSASQQSQSYANSGSASLGFTNQLHFDQCQTEFGNKSDLSSGQVTPGIDASWDQFIDENGSWAENAT